MSRDFGENSAERKDLTDLRSVQRVVADMIKREERNYDQTVNIDPSSTLAKKSLPILSGLRALLNRITYAIELVSSNNKIPDEYSIENLKQELRQIFDPKV